MILDLGPMFEDPETGNVLRQVGGITMIVKGRFDPAHVWRLVMLVNDRMRIGRAYTGPAFISGKKRFSTQLWDGHHKRWAKSKAFQLTQLLGCARADDPGLAALGIPFDAPPPQLIVAGDAFATPPRRRLISLSE